MKLLKNKFVLFGAGAVAFLTMASAGIALANPSYFAIPAKLATATSSPQYLVLGTTQSTTTPIIYDSYNISGTNQQTSTVTTNANDSADSLALAEYVVASSTSTVFKTWIYYSDGIDANGNNVNCASTPKACDWYENNLDTYAAGNIAIATPNTYSYTYASTSMDLQSSYSLTETRGAKLIGVKAPLRYVAAVVTISGANGSVALKFVPKKQLK